MHIIQSKILDLSETHNLADLTLREIGELVGDKHPQKIKHHLDQLFKKGFLRRNGPFISRVDARNDNDTFYYIPVYGQANCGQALSFTDDSIESYLTVSENVVDETIDKDIFAVKAVGNSMNTASVKGKSINDGDYVLIDSSQKDLSFYENKYVLSSIDGLANIKKFNFDKNENRIVLSPESSEPFAPILIHSSDFDQYMINGVVKEVIKNPQTTIN